MSPLPCVVVVVDVVVVVVVVATGAGTGAGEGAGVQENPAMSPHDQDPQLVEKSPHFASQFSVQSCPLQEVAHVCLASAQQRVLEKNLYYHRSTHVSLET